jgi:hypothetical protein
MRGGGAVASRPVPEPLIRWSTYPNAYERTLAGRIERHTVVSALLADNPLGDPADRPVEVYVPPGYDEDPERRYPSIYVIQGYTGAGPMWHNRSPFRPTFPEALDALFAGGDAPSCIVVFVDAWTAFWEDFASRPPMSKQTDGDLVITYGVAAAFSADEDGTVHLPFDLHTGQLVDDVWARWLAWDPVRMVPAHADALRGLRAIYLDGGTRDEWYLDLGALAFRDALAQLGVTDVACELFDATHGAIDYRYPRGLAYLAERLASDP